MFGIGTGELLALGVLALIVLGPEKLPKFAADAARMLRQVRQMAHAATEDVRRELGPELQDISLDDLNPRSLLRKHVLEPDDEQDRAADRAGRSTARRRAATENPSASPRATDDLEEVIAPPYDPEAT